MSPNSSTRESWDHYLNGTDLDKDLKKKSVRGGAVTAVSQAVKFVLRLGATMVLARLILPEDYGLIAMVAVVTHFATMFKSMGLSIATIQKDQITHKQISSLFWANVAVSLVIGIILAALAPAVSWFYDKPQLTHITLVFAVGFPISGLGIQHQAILRRHMRFFTLEILQTISIAAAIGLAIAAAWRGAGYWALVTMHLGTSVFTALLPWLAVPWRPGLPHRRVGARSMFALGGNLTGFNVVNYFSRNTDNILIGKFWGAQSLGLYSKAYSLLLEPLNQLRQPLTAVAMPALSRLQKEPKRFRRAFLELLGVQLIPFPLFSVLIVGHDWVVRLVLGEQWTAAGPIFAWLSIAGALQVLLMTNGLLFIPQNRAGELLRWGIINSLISMLSFVVGLRWGPVGVAAAYTGANLLVVTPLLVFLAGRKGAVSSKDFAFGIIPFFLILAVVTGALYLLRVVLSPDDMITGILSLTVSSILLTAIIYISVPVTRKALKQAFGMLRELKGRKQS